MSETPWNYFDDRLKTEVGFPQNRIAEALVGTANDPATPPEERLWSANLFSYLHYGQQLFVVGADLADAFAKTDVSDVPTDVLNPPYPTLFVSLPGCTMMLGEGKEPVGGFFVTREENRLFLHMCSRDGYTEIEGVTMPNSKMQDLEIDSDQNGNARALTNRIMTRIAVNLLIYLNSKTPKVMVQEPLSVATGNKTSPKKLAKLARRAARLSGARITWVYKDYVHERVAENDPRARGKRHWISIRGHWHGHWLGSKTAPDGTPRLGERLEMVFHAPVFNSNASIAEAAHVYRIGDGNEKAMDMVGQTAAPVATVKAA